MAVRPLELSSTMILTRAYQPHHRLSWLVPIALQAAAEWNFQALRSEAATPTNLLGLGKAASRSADFTNFSLYIHNLSQMLFSGTVVHGPGSSWLEP